MRYRVAKGMGMVKGKTYKGPIHRSSRILSSWHENKIIQPDLIPDGIEFKG
jgi:hypothetical protein